MQPLCERKLGPSAPLGDSASQTRPAPAAGGQGSVAKRQPHAHARCSNVHLAATVATRMQLRMHTGEGALRRAPRALCRPAAERASLGMAARSRVQRWSQH